MRLTYNGAKWIVIALVFIETSSATYFLQNHPQIISLLTFSYFLSGILLSIIPLFFYQVNQDSFSEPSKATKGQPVLIAAFYIAALAYCIPMLVKIFRVIPIDYISSDIIPTIQYLAARWINGEVVYRPIMELWGGLIPNYLPFMWLPFVPLILLHTEIRWTTVVLFFSAMGLLLWLMLKYARVNWLQCLLLLMLLGNLMYIQVDYNRFFFAWTQEGMIIGFYIFLGYALIKNNPWLTGIAITLCLLSRYSLFFWVPGYLLFQLLAGNRKKAITQIIVLSVLMLAIFVIPFFIKNPMFFFHMPEQYAHDNINAWAMNYDSLQQSLGFAKYFATEHLYFLHNLNIILSVSVVAVFYGVMYIFRKNKNLNLAFAGVCGLKLTLTFFYGFVEVPFFYYLFMMPTVFSYILVIHFFNPKTQLKSAVN